MVPHFQLHTCVQNKFLKRNCLCALPIKHIKLPRLVSSFTCFFDIKEPFCWIPTTLLCIALDLSLSQTYLSHLINYPIHHCMFNCYLLSGVVVVMKLNLLCLDRIFWTSGFDWEQIHWSLMWDTWYRLMKWARRFKYWVKFMGQLFFHRSII